VEEIIPGEVQEVATQVPPTMEPQDVPKYRLVAPHHKNERHSGNPLEIDLPRELCVLLDYHLSYGMDLVMGGRYSPEDQPFVFVKGSTLKQLVAQQVSQIWCARVLPPRFRFGPQTARSVFVTGMRDDSLPRPDFTEEAAAEAMGNSLEVWEKVYDKLQRTRAVQDSIGHLAKWRESLVEKRVAALAAAAAAGAAAAASDDEDAAAAAGDGSEVFHSAEEGSGADSQ